MPNTDQETTRLHVDNMQAIVTDMEMVPNRAAAEQLTQQCDGKLLRYEQPSSNHLRTRTPDGNTIWVPLQQEAVIDIPQAVIVQVTETSSEVFIENIEGYSSDHATRAFAVFLNKAADLAAQGRQMKQLTITISMNSDRPPPSWPQQGTHTQTETLQTENGLVFQHTTTCSRDDSLEEHTGSPSWEIVAHAMMAENQMPGAYDLELLIKATYSQAAALVLNMSTED